MPSVEKSVFIAVPQTVVPEIVVRFRRASGLPPDSSRATDAVYGSVPDPSALKSQEVKSPSTMRVAMEAGLTHSMHATIAA